MNPIPNSNEVQNYLVLAVIAATTAWAGNHGIDASTWSSMITSFAPIAVGVGTALFSLWRNHNMKKVPEKATAIELPNGSTPAVGTTINLAPLTGSAKVVG
jgi:hypothetical protein